jgi:hypothetical protein
MTIPSTTRKAGPYFGTGAQTVWPFTFKVFAAGDVAVTTTTAQGLNTLLVLNTDYSVTLNANQDTSPGGVVTYPLAGSPLPPGSRLTIVGDLDYDQPMDLPDGGDFSPVVIENQLDRTVMQIQQLAEAQSRSLQVSVASSTVDTTLPLPVPSHVIGWDQSGTGMQNYSLTDLIVSGVYSDWVTDVFVGTGTQTAFGLQRSPGVLGNCDVSVDGLTALPGIDFFLAANILTFAVAPASGAQILVRYGSAAQQAPTVGAFLKTETQTAGAGQTAFTLTNPYQVGLGALSVFVNGVRMEPVYDYTETNTTTVTFTSGLVAGDRVLFIIGMEITTGTPGRGITSVNRTSGTGAPGTTDTYTITYSDSTTSTFQVYNGANGTGSGDVTGPASAVNNNFAAFDATTGKLIKDSGSSAASFEPAITAGTTAQYRRGDKTWQDFATAVRAAVMTGLSTATATAVVAADTLLVAIGKLQAQVNGKQATLVSGTNIKTVNGTTLLGSGDLAVGGAGDVTLNGTQTLSNKTLTSLNTGQLAGFRNSIINGKMDISQRNGSTAMALTTTATYFNDRWCCVASTTPSGTLVTGRTTIVGALGTSQLGDGFANCLYFQRQSGSYAGFARAIQVLETTESLSLAGRTVTLSFWAAINSGWLGGNITASVVTGTGTDQSSSQFLAGTASGQATAGTTTITPTATLTRYSVQATIPAGATQVAVILQNAGWSGSGTSSDIIALTGVQLEVGAVATPFEHRPYGTELALCQRYCEVSKTAILRNQFNTGFTYQWFTFAVQKRVIPTFFLQNTSYTNGSGGTGNAASLTGLELAFNASSAGGFISTDLVSVAEL